MLAPNGTATEPSPHVHARARPPHHPHRRNRLPALRPRRSAAAGDELAADQLRSQELARLLPHAHAAGLRHRGARPPGLEEFIILEGELIDSDGTVFKAGDFVSYAPGTRHNSRTETGCLIAVFEWRPPPGL